MILRQATLTDAAPLAAVQQQQPRAANWGEQGFLGEIEQPCAIILCAEKENKIVGFIAGRAAAGNAEILNFAVHPDCLRQGIGKALLDRMLLELQQRAIQQVSLEVAQDNLAACALYEKMGFTRWNVRKDFYGAGCDALILGKKL